MRKAKILATLGPSSSTETAITAMISAGISAVRINKSHGTNEEHEALINNARAAAQKLGSPLAVLVDLCGPKIRTKTLVGGLPVELKEGGAFTITAREIEGTVNEVSTNYAQLPEVVGPGRYDPYR